MKTLAALCIVAAIGFLVYSVWRDRSRQGRGGIDPILLKATKGDVQLAQRLLEGVKYRYPGKSDRWYTEKVLYDLRRDGAGTGR
ncbi:MAG: hypothetical protein VKJ24_01040 [Synechococcales bacterium]|nr:hypothetical protein [Synechococcales bacterium]